ncbi:hypothetical protein Tco_0248190 [Tanacetum coccineum]
MVPKDSTYRPLPSATTTFTCFKPIEVVALDANHLRYITDRFRYTFINEKMKRRARSFIGFEAKISCYRCSACALDKAKMMSVETYNEMLRHHARKFLAISESGEDSHIWKEIKKTIHIDADKLLRKLERHMLYYPSPTSFKFCKNVFSHVQIMSKD